MKCKAALCRWVIPSEMDDFDDSLDEGEEFTGPIERNPDLQVSLSERV